MIWKVGVSDRPQKQKDTVFLSPKAIFYYLFLFFDLMGKIFCVALQSEWVSKKRRGKTPRQICYICYCKLPLKIRKIQQEVINNEISRRYF